MPILIRNVCVDLDEPEEAIIEHAAQRLQIPVVAIRSYAIVRRSLDARKKGKIHFSYQIELELEDVKKHPHIAKRLGASNAIWLEPKKEEPPTRGSRRLTHRPVVIGFGPAGMFAAWRLAQFGYRPIVLERGREVRRRHRDIMQRFYCDGEFDPTSNLLFGEGGAGTYSDGKLYTRVNDPLGRTVFETLYQHGAPPDILVDARPHIGSDRLPTICARIRGTIEKAGGEVRFECQTDDIRVDGGRLRAVHVRSSASPDGDESASVAGEWIDVGPTIFAVGHSARDTVRMLHDRGTRIDAKPFQIGVRIEHPQAIVDRWQYGAAAEHGRLGPAEYHMIAKGAAGEKQDVFSFCMCPGGTILPTNESPGLIATNGASRSQRSTPTANSGLVLTMDPSTLPRGATGNVALDGLAFLEECERRAFEATGQTYRVPVQRASDFLEGRPSDGALDISYPLGGEWCEVGRLLPAPVIEAIARALPVFENKFPGFAGPEGLITAPETRASSPVRILRDPDTRQSTTVEDLYPVGEGAGYAGGIISAAIDGIRTADTLIRCYAPPS